MASLLDGIDPSAIPGMDPETLKQLQAFMAMMQPSQATIDQAKKNRWIDFGLGIMGARKGGELQAIGQSGLNAMGNYNKDIAAQQGLQGQNVSQAMQMLQMAKANQALQLKNTILNQAGDVFGPQGAPPQMLPQAPTQGMGDRGLGTAPPPAPTPPPQPQAQGQAPDRAAQYRRLAEIYARGGDAESAKKYSEIANQIEQQAEYSQTPQTVMVDGKPTLVLINKRGESKPLAGMTPAEKAHFLDLGNKTVAADPFTGNIIPGGAIYEKSQSPDSKAANALGYANLAERKRGTNLQYGLDEKGDPTGSTDALAKLIANYDTPFPATLMYRRPEMGAQILQKVQEINPSYDAKNYATAQQAANAFAKGPEARRVTSFNVALQHLDTLGQAASALGNGNIQLFNKAQQFYKQQTGDSVPTNFDGVKQIVGAEIVKAIVGSGGGVEDRKRAADAISRSSSPQQLAGVIDEYKTLMVGQLSGLRQQYESNTKRSDFDKFLSPQALGLVQQKAAAAAETRPIYKDAKGNRAYKNPDGSYTPVQ